MPRNLVTYRNLCLWADTTHRPSQGAPAKRVTVCDDRPFVPPRTSLLCYLRRIALVCSHSHWGFMDPELLLCYLTVKYGVGVTVYNLRFLWGQHYCCLPSDCVFDGVITAVYLLNLFWMGSELLLCHLTVLFLWNQTCTICL